MATTVKYGSKGDDVLALQNALNQQGYGLTADGIFGDNTLSALKQYQQANGLTVDGIAGTNTWSALTGGGTSGSASGSGTAYNPSYNFSDLLSSLQRGGGYTSLTDDQIRQQAQNQYDPIFNQSKLSADQAHEKGALALQQQLEALAPTYDKQRENTAQAFMQAHSNADRQSLSRGMQRSSYNSATLGNIDVAGAKAHDEIGAAQARDENAINQQKTLNAEQHAQYIRQLEVDYETQIAALSDALRDKDYDRATAARNEANALELELAKLSQGNYQWEQEFAENQRQFNASLAASKSGSGSSGGTNTALSAYSSPTINSLLGGVAGTGLKVADVASTVAKTGAVVGSIGSTSTAKKPTAVVNDLKNSAAKKKGNAAY